MAQSRYRVLVIDDDELVARAFARTLSAHHVTALFSAEDALHRAASGETWDVILCDLQMPGMDGAQFCALLERFRPDLVPRIAFVTAGAFSARMRTFLECGSHPIALKPVEPHALRSLVCQVATGSTT